MSDFYAKRSNFSKQRELKKGTKYGVQKIQKDKQKKAKQETIKCPKGGANELPIMHNAESKTRLFFNAQSSSLNKALVKHLKTTKLKCKTTTK